jgi:hypothetical protein
MKEEKHSKIIRIPVYHHQYMHYIYLKTVRMQIMAVRDGFVGVQICTELTYMHT